MNLSKAVALRIDDLLIKNKMSRYRLEIDSGVSRSTMTCVFNGRNKDVRLSTIAKVCAVFKISLHEFFDDKVFDLAIMDFEY